MRSRIVQQILARESHPAARRRHDALLPRAGRRPRRAAAGRRARARRDRRRGRAARLAGAARRSRRRSIRHAAQRIAPGDPQRIQRALEVWRLTGKPLSALQGGGRAELPFTLKGIALVPERARLHRRIEQRFDAMLRAGLIDEVKRAAHASTGWRPRCRACARWATARCGNTSKGKYDKATPARKGDRGHAPARQASAHLAAQLSRPRAHRPRRRGGSRGRAAAPDHSFLYHAADVQRREEELQRRPARRPCRGSPTPSTARCSRGSTRIRPTRLCGERDATSYAATTVTTIAGHCRRSRMSIAILRP